MFSRCEMFFFYLNLTVLICIVLYDCSKTALKNLRIVYTKSLRKQLGNMLVKCLFVLTFLLLTSYLESMYNFFVRSRLMASHNCILFSTCSSVVPLYTPIWALWECILTT